MPKIFAIDPGTTGSAFVFWDTEEEKLLEYGIAKNEELIDNIDYTNVDVAVIEMVASYGMAVGQSVFETVYWIGRYAKELESNNIDVVRVYRKQVCMTLCNSTRAKDSNIRQALIDRYGKQGTKKEPGVLYGISKDVWQALAIAIHWQEISKE